MGGRLFNRSPLISPSRDLPVRVPNLPSRIRIRSRRFEEKDVFNEVENGTESRTESGALFKSHDAGYGGNAGSHSRSKSHGDESDADTVSTVGSHGAGADDRIDARGTGSDARG